MHQKLPVLIGPLSAIQPFNHPFEPQTSRYSGERLTTGPTCPICRLCIFYFLLYVTLRNINKMNLKIDICLVKTKSINKMYFKIDICLVKTRSYKESIYYYMKVGRSKQGHTKKVYITT